MNRLLSRRFLKRRFSFVMVSIGALLSIGTQAWACPVCGARETNTLGTLILIGVMLAVPYAVASFALRAIRRADEKGVDVD